MIGEPSCWKKINSCCIFGARERRRALNVLVRQDQRPASNVDQELEGLVDRVLPGIVHALEQAAQTLEPSQPGPACGGVVAGAEQRAGSKKTARQMITESNDENAFTVDLSKYERVGFHGTCHLAGQLIESHGFLPTKIASDKEHEDVLKAAASLGIETGAYRSWLEMRSVTFTHEPEPAVQHLRRGLSAGQGTAQLIEVVSLIERSGNECQRELAKGVRAKVEALKASPPVVYAVDLSGLERLTVDARQPLYQFYWNPALPVPITSEIGPSRLIARLDVRN